MTTKLIAPPGTGTAPGRPQRGGRGPRPGPAPGRLVAARGALGGACHRAVRGRPDRPLHRRPGRRRLDVLPRQLRGRRMGARPGRAGRAARQDPGRGSAHGLAAIGAAAVGQVLDGGLLIVIFATSGALEAVATHRTAQAVRGLLDLAPEQAVRITADGDRGDRGRRGPADRRRDPGPPGRANRRRRPGALRRQRRGPGHDHRRAAAGGQVGRATRCSQEPPTAPARCGCGWAGDPGTPWSPGSWPWSRTPPPPRPAPSCSSRRSSSATRSAWSPPPCSCSRSRCWPGRRSSRPCCAR